MRLPAPLLRRKINACKSDFGHILVVAGSARYSGAAVLCAHAAMRAGAGLVTLAIPEGINNAAIKIKPREVMTLPLPQTSDGALSLKAFPALKKFFNNVDVIVVGPGMDRHASTLALARQIIATTDKSLVIDADALFALKGHLSLLRTARTAHWATVLTPHPGEMSRLLEVSVEALQRKRKAIAEKFALAYNVTIVLKGSGTVVTQRGKKTFINSTGNPGMATAGSGDVLAGIIAAFLGQGLSAFDAAKYGVYLHGLAGDLAAKEKTQISLIASDIIEKLPEAIKKCL